MVPARSRSSQLVDRAVLEWEAKRSSSAPRFTARSVVASQCDPSPAPRDRVGIEERAAQLGKRSIKTAANEQGIRLAVSMLDLTTLEGADTAGKVRHLCAKAVCPAPTMPEIPSVAAICVYSSSWSASHANRYEAPESRPPPSPLASRPARSPWRPLPADTEDAVQAGADEIDMVISREAFLAGDDTRVMQGNPRRNHGALPATRISR